MSLLVQLRIADLEFVHDVNEKKVRKYMEEIVRGNELHPTIVDYCVHSGRYSLSDGHHRTVAKYRLGITYVTCELDFCFKYDCTGPQVNCKSYAIHHLNLEKKPLF